MTTVPSADGATSGLIAALNTARTGLPSGALVVDAPFYRFLVESSQDLIWSVDAKGRWTFLNAACERIYGFRPEEMLGRPFVERIHPEQQAADLALFARLLAGGSIAQHETRHLSRDGPVIDMLFSPLPIRETDGTIVG